MTTEPTSTPYDDVPYPTFAHAQLHPDRIGTVAHLFGIDAAPAGDCTYLELGCGDAGTLLALAYALPGSRFLGYDLAATAVARANTFIEGLGISNVEVRQGDVAALPEDLGTFDYVVSHGVFSWVPEPARLGILRACGRHLGPEGVAYVSYNANPSGLLREMSRQMLRYHLGRSDHDPEEAYEEAANLLGFVSASRSPGDPWRVLLEAEQRHLRGRPASSFVHDEMAEINTPFWLHEFLALADDHGLSFLGEAEDVGTTDIMLSAPAQALLTNLEDEPETREQYLDFFVARRFRQTLLCRADASPVHPVDVGRMDGVLVSSPARPSPDEPVDLAEGTRVDFAHETAVEATVDAALVKAALCLLAPRWPAPATFPSLLEGAHRLTSGVRREADDDAASLGAALLQLYPTRLIRLSRHVPTWPLSAEEIGDRPTASLLARLQVLSGTHAVASLRAEPVALDLPGRVVLEACDGTRDLEGLIDHVALVMPEVDGRPTDPTWIVTEGLRQLAELHLMVR
jgi:SAM-dependent methyltransferase